MEVGKPREEFQLSLLEAMSMLKRSWDKVTQPTIANCFKKAGFLQDDSVSDDPSEEDEYQDSEPIHSELFKEWNIRPEDYFEVDANVLTSSHETNVPPVTATHSSAMQDSSDGSDNDDCGSQHDEVFHNEALECTRKPFFTTSSPTPAPSFLTI